MTWITAGGKYPLLQKVNKNTGEWLPLSTALAKATDVSPNLVVNYEQKVAPGELGSRWDAVLYLFWGPREGFDYEHWFNGKMTSIEALGYWQEISSSPQIANLSTNATDFFQLWSVIGIIDAPPFIQNGAEYEENPIPEHVTRVEFGTTTSTTSSTETKSTVGPYIQTGEKSRLKLELTATVGEQTAQEVETSVSFSTALLRSRDGEVMGCWLAPELKVYHVQWHNPADPNETNNFMYPMVLTTNTELRCFSFDPAELPWPGAAGMPETYFPTNFPMHRSENDLDRLATYSITPQQPYWFKGTLDWRPNSTPSITWSRTGSTNTSATVALEFKVGAEIKHRLGFGVEGSYEIQTKTTTKVTTESALHVTNPFFDTPLATCLTEINKFTVEGRWLAPNSSGYWVPLNRQGCGDQPWFITYGVPPANIGFFSNPAAKPYLRAEPAPDDSVLVWWEVSPTNWRLQATTSLAPTNQIWNDYSYHTNGMKCFRLESPATGRRFYRLRSP
jgi:hypothetical protein